PTPPAPARVVGEHGDDGPAQRRPQRPTPATALARQEVDGRERGGHTEEEDDALVPTWGQLRNGGDHRERRDRARRDQRPAGARRALRWPAVDEPERQRREAEEGRPGQAIERRYGHEPEGDVGQDAYPLRGPARQGVPEVAGEHREAGEVEDLHQHAAQARKGE